MPDIFSTPMNRRATLKTLASVGTGLLAVTSRGLDSSDDTKFDPLAGILSAFTDESQKKLRSVLSAPGFSGQIPAATVRELVASEHKSISALMLALLPLARTYSHPPISHYQVGIVARGEGGSFYLGFNIEFPGHALGFAVHGEQAALSSAYMHGESGIVAIALSAAPCGHCRQFMNELSPDGQTEILVPQAAPMQLSALLPMAFGPHDLGRKEGAFPIKSTNLVSATRPADAVSQAALDAARTSYAPYSGAHSGAAIATRSGRIFQGSYIENVAFNPSLSPLQTALVQLILAGEDTTAITRVALAEINGAKISQRSATEAVLSAIAPSVRLEVLTATLWG